MTAFTATCNQNIDEVGFQFYAPVDGARTVISSLTGQSWTTSGNLASGNITWTGWDTSDDGLSVFVAADRSSISTQTPFAAYNATVASKLPAGVAWKKCVYGNGSFVSVNTSTTSAAYMRHKEGTTWTASGALPSAAAWSLLAYGNGAFVTVAPGSTSAAISSDNGLTWSAVTLPASLTYIDLKYANGYFVLVASGSRDVYTSTTGANGTWTLQTNALPSTATWRQIAWANTGGANGTWIAVSNATAAAYSTDNGVTWTSVTLPASGNWICAGGKNPRDGRQTFVAMISASTSAAFSYDGILWNTATGPNVAVSELKIITPKVLSGDTIQINNNAILTVDTDQKRFMSGTTAVVVTNGKLKIANTSTTTPIRFGTGRLATTGVLSTISVTNGLGTVEVDGNWIELGTSTGAASQTFTSPYTTGDYIPAVWVETGSGTGIYEPWTNVTGAPTFNQYNYFRNGLRSVGNGDAGTCFTQDTNTTAVQYLVLANCNVLADSHVITCTSTTGLVPGAWVTGRGLPATAVVQEVLSATRFTINAVVANASSSSQGAGWTNIPMIAILPVCSQYSSTLRFGDDVNGKIPPTGAKVKVQNIMLTDYSPANFMNAAITSANAPCYFNTPAGGVFDFNTCIMGESYSNFLQAGAVTLTNVGGQYVPWISECYQVTISDSAFGLPPVSQVVPAPTALGATGSTNSTTTITTPATNALIPGVLVTGTNLHAVTVTSVTSNVAAVVSTAAFGTAGTIAFSYYSPWTFRDHRMNPGTTAAVGSSFTAALWSYVSNLDIDGLVLTFGGHAINATNTNPAIGSANNGPITTQYSNNVTINNVKMIQVGSYPKTRSFVNALSAVVSGTNHTYTNIKAYNISSILHASATSNISCSNVTFRTGLNNEGYNWVNGYRVYTNPATAAFLANDTKYWFKTRSFKTHNIQETSHCSDSMPMCGVMSDPAKYLQMPQRMGVLPTSSTTLAPTVATNGTVWVVLNGAISGNTALVSSDNGATWSAWMMPAAVTTTQWWKVIWCPTQGYFMAIQGGTITSTLVAYSTNGKDWSTVTTPPATAIWQALAFDNSQAANKWVGVSGGNAVSTAGTYATITNGSLVFAASTLASAQWIDVTSDGAGRYVAIAGGSAVGTATSTSTTGSGAWTAGGANASSLWQSIAYGNGTFCCVSASATNGPTACSADATAWTAGTAPTLPTGMSYNKVIYTGTAFVLLAGPSPLNVGAPGVATASQCYVVSTANTATTVTWGTIKYLPDHTFWASMSNNGNAVGVISTQTGRWAYTGDITAGTPTWTLTEGVFPTWNRLSWYQQAQDYTTALTTATSVATTVNSTTVTCADTSAMQVGTVMTLTLGNVLANGVVYIGAGTVSTHTNAVTVTGITNGTTFTINKPALKTASGMTATFYKHLYQVFRSTTEGFSARDDSTLIGTTATSTSGQILFDDTHGLTLGTPYYYRLRKLSGGGAVNIPCSGTAAASTITAAGYGFYNWQTTSELYGKTGTNVLTSLSFNFFVQGIVPGCIVTGTGIPAATTVTDVTDFNTIILSANLTVDVVPRTTGNTMVGFSPAPGMYVYGSNVGMDAKVSTVDSNSQITLTIANTNTFTAKNLRFVVGAEFPEIACIPTAPVVVQNQVLQSTSLATTWTASGTTPASAAVLAPTDVFVGINAAAPTATGSTLLATAANGTLTQTVQTGVGVTYTFSCYARARHPDLRNYLTMKMDLGTATETKNLTNQWARYSVSFVTTANTTAAKFTLPAMGTVVEIASAMVTLGSSIPPITTATTTTIAYMYPQQTLTATNGLVGWMMDGGAGIETNLNAAPGAQHFAHLHVGTTSGFTISDQNQIFSTHSTGDDGTGAMVVAATSASNILLSDCTPMNEKFPSHSLLLNAQSGASGINIKNVVLPINGTTSNLMTIPSAAYSIYLHNIDLINERAYLAALYYDASVNNASSTYKYQNIRSNRTSRTAWNTQSLDTVWKSAPGGNTFPAFNGTTWDLSTSIFNQDGFPISNVSIYDSMFREMTWGATGKGCLDLRMIGSTKAAKPYAVTAGAPYFDNSGNLFFQAIGDQMVIEWPHTIKGLTGFSERLAHIYGTDVGLSPVTSLGVLVEYDLNKGSGYSGSWKQLNLNDGMVNLSAETGISASTGVRIKLRLTARAVMKYSGVPKLGVAGWTIQNNYTGATSTATATIVDDELVTTTTGSLAVSSIVGEWVPANLVYSGTLNTTLTGTTAQTTAVMNTSTISGTTLTVGTLASGTIVVGMLLSGGNVLGGTYIASNISGAGNGSTWVVSRSQTLVSTNLTGTQNVVTVSSTSNMYSGAAFRILTTTGGLTAATTYYVGAVLSGTTFTAVSAYFGTTSPTLTLTTAQSVPLAGYHGSITAVNTVGVFAPQPTSKLTAIRLFTEVDTDQANNYAYATPTLTLTGIQTGSDVVVLTAGTTTERANIDSVAGTTYDYTYSDLGNVDIGVFKVGYVPFYIRNYALLTSNAALPIAQVPDRNYA